MRRDFFTHEPLTVSNLLRDTFAALRSCFPVILASGASVGIPAALLMFVMLAGVGFSMGDAKEPSTPVTIGVVAGGIFLVIAVIQTISASLMHAVFQVARGNPARIGDCLRVAFRRLPQVLAVAVAAGLLIMLGAIACLVPGIIASLMFTVAVPVAVIENLGVQATLRRCDVLTKGCLGTIFGTTFVLGMIQWPISLLGEFMKESSPGLYLGLTLVSVTLNLCLQATLSAVLYYRLRLAKEGIDVNQVAAVFE